MEGPVGILVVSIVQLADRQLVKQGVVAVKLKTVFSTQKRECVFVYAPIYLFCLSV